MLTQLYPFLDPALIIADLALRLRTLADDCDRLALRSQAPASLLHDAPLLEHWLPVLSPEGVQLAGLVTAHPIHHDGFVMTSPLWFADPHDTWVRTLSRFYRLGSPRDPDDLRRILLSRHSQRNGNSGNGTA
jgi:hypothetical protein